MDRFDTPELRIQGSWIRGLTPTSLEVSFTVDLYNPNRYAIHVHHLRYVLIVGDNELGAVEKTELITLPARQARRLDLLLTASLAGRTPGAPTIGEMPYELRAVLAIDAPWYRHRAQVSSRSVLRIDVPLGLALRRPAQQNLEPTLPCG
jgi:hypothetical protein